MDDARAGALFEQMPDGLVVVDPESGTVVDANRAYLDLVGTDRETAVGEPFVVGGPPGRAADDLVDRLLGADDGRVRSRVERADGSAVPVEFNPATAAVDGAERLLVSVRRLERGEPVRDIADLERTLDLALEGTSTGVWEWNLRTGEVFVDEQTERLFGYDPGTFGGTEAELLDQVHPDDVPAVEAAYERALAEGNYQIDYRVQVDGETRRWLDTRARVLYEDPDGDGEGGAADGDGEPVRMVGVVTDVTGRKERERELREQRDNLELLNQVLRHDIRNDLQVVTAYADLLGDHVDEARAEHLETLRESADHAVDLTTTARDLADVMLTTTEETRRVDLAGTLTDAVDQVQSGYPDAVVTVDGPLPDVQVEATGMLDSVFDNLLTNAIQHNDRPVPEVTVTATDADGWVTVRVADDGPGVPDEQKEVVFGKGETGLDSAGSGIGLYLVRTLVETFGGDVRVEDNDSRGAVFVVELPVAD